MDRMYADVVIERDDGTTYTQRIWYEPGCLYEKLTELRASLGDGYLIVDWY